MIDLDATLGGTVALSQGASSPRLKAAKKAPQTPWRTMTNQASKPCRGGLWAADETRTSGPIAQCNSAGIVPPEVIEDFIQGLDESKTERRAFYGAMQ
jgi:hypothetical protein